MEINIIETILHLSDICYSLNEDTLKNENLSRPESFILLSIMPGEMISSSELSSRNRLSPSRVSRLVDDMIKKHLLERTEADDDRRFVNLTLSKEGIKKHTVLMKLKNQCEKKIKSQLRDDELTTVGNGLVLLTQVMEK
jgi:DNA-binding MarR family transcriptional regulator